METVETQAQVTEPDTKSGETTANTTAESKTNVVDNPITEPKEPYKSFATQEEFDRHSAGILNSAQRKAEKELLAMLGLKPDEKDKLAKFKEAYDATLTEAEKKEKELSEITTARDDLQKKLLESQAIVSALSKLTGKNSGDVDKLVKMAKGLVDENTTMEQALEQVMELTKVETKQTVPAGKPLSEPNSGITDSENPFKTNNLTAQGLLIKNDPSKARELYKLAKGKEPSW